MGYFVLRSPRANRLQAMPLVDPCRETPCPAAIGHTRVQRVQDLQLEVSHSRHEELMIWSWGSDVVVHAHLAQGLQECGLTGFRLRPASVRFRDGNLASDYFEVVVTGWAGVARPESGIKLVEYCPGCFRRKYSGLEDANKMIDWDQWSGEDFFIVWPLVKFIFITERAAEALKSLNVRSYTLANLQDLELKRGFGLPQLSVFMPEDLVIKYGRPLGLE